MHDNANFCVLNNGSKSDFFSCNVGVREGGNLSPILFSIFLQDFEYFEYYKGLDTMLNCFKENLSSDDFELY